MISVKLTWRNIQRCSRDYWAYCITLGLTVALVYAFNQMIVSQELRQISVDFASAASFLLAVSIAVMAIITGLVRYATHTMLRKRAREFATYLLMGVKRNRICRMFLLENLLIGLFSFFGGSLAGTLLYQLLRASALSAFQTSYTFSLEWSSDAFFLTFLYFLAAFLIALHKNMRRLKKSSIRSLMLGESCQEQAPLRHPVLRLAVFFTSCLLLAVTIGAIPYIYQSTEAALLLLFEILLLIAAIFGIYMGIPSFLNTLRRLPWIRWKGANLFLLRQITSHPGSNGAVMGVLAILMTLSLFCFTAGFAARAIYPVVHSYTHPFDVMLSAGTPEVDFGPAKKTIEALCGIQEVTDYQIYSTGQNRLAQALEELSPRTLYLKQSDPDFCIALSTYNHLRVQSGRDPVSLQKGEYLLHIQSLEYAQILRQTSPIELEIHGTLLTQKGMLEEGMGLQYQSNPRRMLVVLSDEICANLNPVSSCLAVTTHSQPDNTLQHILRRMNYSTLNGAAVQNFSLALDIKNADSSNYIGYLTISFSAFYLGLVLLLICAAVLALQQMRTLASQQYRFSVLSQLGLREQALHSLIRRQLAIFFGLPALLPLVLNTFLYRMAIPEMYDPLIGRQIAGSLFGAYVLFLVVYLCYFVASYVSFRYHIVSEPPN